MGFICIHWRLPEVRTRTIVISRFLARPLPRLVFAACAALTIQGAFGQGFKFSDEEQKSKAEEAMKEQARSMSIADRLSTPCKAQLKNKKIMLIIGEESSGGAISANQQNYRPHYEAINQRLRAVGLKTYSPEEIRKQIAQAEIDAYFKGDTDAALAASRRFGASFVLRGLIDAQARVNPIIHVNEVTLNMNFMLTDSSGRMISEATAEGGTYTGADVRGTAAKMINEKADDITAKLYSDYCSAPAKGNK